MNMSSLSNVNGGTKAAKKGKPLKKTAPGGSKSKPKGTSKAQKANVPQEDSASRPPSQAQVIHPAPAPPSPTREESPPAVSSATPEKVQSPPAPLSATYEKVQSPPATLSPTPNQGQLNNFPPQINQSIDEQDQEEVERCEVARLAALQTRKALQERIGFADTVTRIGGEYIHKARATCPRASMVIKRKFWWDVEVIAHLTEDDDTVGGLEVVTAYYKENAPPELEFGNFKFAMWAYMADAEGYKAVEQHTVELLRTLVMPHARHMDSEVYYERFGELFRLDSPVLDPKDCVDDRAELSKFLEHQQASLECQLKNKPAILQFLDECAKHDCQNRLEQQHLDQKHLKLERGLEATIPEQAYRIVLQEEEECVEQKHLEQERLEWKRIEQECCRQEEREQEQQDEPEELGSEGQEVDQDSIYSSKLNSVGDLTHSNEEDIPIRHWSSRHPRRSKGSLEVDSNDANSTLFDGNKDEENRPLRCLKRCRSTDNSSDQEPNVGHQAKTKVKPKPRGKAKGQSKATATGFFRIFSQGKRPSFAVEKDLGKNRIPGVYFGRKITCEIVSEWPGAARRKRKDFTVAKATEEVLLNSSDQEPDVGQQAKVKPRPRGKSQGKRPSEWRDDDKEIPSNDPLMAKGPLPKSVKNEIDTAHAKFKAEIAVIAHKSGRKLQSCYNYLDANNQVPRATNCFNIFQIWYGVHSEKCRKPGVTASEWTKIVTKEYYAFLRNNLSEGEFHDNEARQHVLKEQFEWYETNMENFIEAKKKKGKMSNLLQKIMRPFIALVCYHIGGYAIHEDHEPLTWVAMTDLQKIRETRGTQMHAQAADLRALVR
ncbi:hypothetical protein BT96DRAFT_946289 [Gymnopus androsaceus JB14]|uniref:Uncharacterized protein n=1 Tax=Gymnopus androsaceus JB14 TaxID=1447944 RepID=A0A6A4GYT4_9AGAR|nr:hypothetical protein BT96DRAFT_946289 [Gymnopus androsaceus JB14]